MDAGERKRGCDHLPPGRILATVSSPSAFAIDLPTALLERARAGDMAAFEQIYRRFERPVYALAWRLLGDADEAMDVLHDAMLKVHRGLAGFRGEAPLWGWIRQIASNEALMRLRARGRLQFVDELPEDDSDAQSGLPPEAAEGALLERALAALPHSTRAVLWLYHGEGFTHEEIASAMGRTASFSKSQLSRGTRRLRELLRIPQEVAQHA